MKTTGLLLVAALAGLGGSVHGGERIVIAPIRASLVYENPHWYVQYYGQTGVTYRVEGRLLWTQAWVGVNLDMPPANGWRQLKVSHSPYHYFRMVAYPSNPADELVVTTNQPPCSSAIRIRDHTGVWRELLPSDGPLSDTYVDCPTGTYYVAWPVYGCGQPNSAFRDQGLEGPGDMLYVALPAEAVTWSESQVRNRLAAAEDSGGKTNIWRIYVEVTNYLQLAAELQANPRFQVRDETGANFDGTVWTSVPVALYIHSDDGSTVTVNGGEEVSHRAVPHSWDNLSGSFHYLACLPPGSNYITVAYTNMDYAGNSDMDGVTLIGLKLPPWRTHGIVGTNQIPYFGPQDRSGKHTYMLDAPAVPGTIQWRVSPLLSIVESNDFLQSIKVEAVGRSRYSLDAWVAASWQEWCNGPGTRSNWVDLTVYEPLGLELLSYVARPTAGGYTVQRRLRILDQFDRAFRFPSFLSIEKTLIGTPRIVLNPDVKNFPVGQPPEFADYVSAGALVEAGRVIQIIRCHRLPNGEGNAVGQFLIIVNPTDEQKIRIIPY